MTTSSSEMACEPSWFACSAAADNSLLVYCLGLSSPRKARRMQERNRLPSAEQMAREWREGILVSPATQSATDTVALSIDAAHERKRDLLCSLIRQMTSEPWPLGEYDAPPVLPSAAETAAALIKALPSHMVLPKVAPDGEGGVLLVWEDGGEPAVAASLEAWRMHIVVGPGRASASHIDNVPFDGELPPQQLLSLVPRR